MDSTFDGSKWSHNVGAAEIGKLGKLAAEINEITNATAETVARAQIKVGRLLNEARAMIPGDLQFGKWREANTAITNKSTANKLMNLATQVGSGRITQELLDALPMSTLKELISAPDSVVESALRMVVVEGETPTREQVRTMNRDAKSGQAGDTTEPRELDGEAEVATQPKPAPTMAPRAPVIPPKQTENNRHVIDKIINMPLMQRVKHLDPSTNNEFFKVCKPLEWAFLVMGLDPDPATYPNIQVIEILQLAYTGELTAFNAEGEALVTKVIDRAVKMINAEY